MKTAAPCPFCGKTLTRTESNLKLDVQPGEVPTFDITWRVKHEEPLCFEWASNHVTPDDLFAAFSDQEEE